MDYRKLGFLLVVYDWIIKKDNKEQPGITRKLYAATKIVYTQKTCLLYVYYTTYANTNVNYITPISAPLNFLYTHLEDCTVQVHARMLYNKK